MSADQAGKAGGRDPGTMAVNLPAVVEPTERTLLPGDSMARLMRCAVKGDPRTADFASIVAIQAASEVETALTTALAPWLEDAADAVAAASTTRADVPVPFCGKTVRTTVTTPAVPYGLFFLRMWHAGWRASTTPNIPGVFGVVLLTARWEVVDLEGEGPGDGVVFDPRADPQICVDRQGLDIAAVEAVVAAADTRGARTFKLVVRAPASEFHLKDLSQGLGVETARAWVVQVVIDAYTGLAPGDRPTLRALLRGVERRGAGLLYDTNADDKFVTRAKTPPVQSMWWAMFFLLMVEVVVAIDDAGVDAQLQKLRQKLRGLCWDPSNTRDLHNKDRRATITELVRRAWILSAAGGKVTLDDHALNRFSEGIGHADLEARVTAALEAAHPVRAPWTAPSPRAALNALMDAPGGVATIALRPVDGQRVDINEVAIWVRDVVAAHAEVATNPWTATAGDGLSALVWRPTDEIAAVVAAVLTTGSPRWSPAEMRAVVEAAAAPATTFNVEVVAPPEIPEAAVVVLGSRVVEITNGWAAGWAARKAKAELLAALPRTVADALIVVAARVAPIAAPLWQRGGKNSIVAATTEALVGIDFMPIAPRVMAVPTNGPGHAVEVYEAAGLRFFAPPPGVVAALGLDLVGSVKLVRPLPGGAVGTGKWLVALGAELEPVEATPTAVAAALALPPATRGARRAMLSIQHVVGAGARGVYRAAEWRFDDKPAPVHELSVILLPVPLLGPDGLTVRLYVVVFDSAVKSAKDASARVLTTQRAMPAAAFVERVERATDPGMSWAAGLKRAMEIIATRLALVPAGGKGAVAEAKPQSSRKRRRSDRAPPMWDPDHQPPVPGRPGCKEIGRAIASSQHNAPACRIFDHLAKFPTLCGALAAIMGADLPEGQPKALIEGVAAMQPTFAAWGLPTYQAAVFSTVTTAAEAAVVAAGGAKLAETRRSLSHSEAVAGVLDDVVEMATSNPECECCAKTAKLARALGSSAFTC